MSNSSFGDFGKLPKRGLSVAGVLKICFIICILIAVPTAYSGWSKFYTSIGEREAPQISFENPPIGIGLSPLNLNIKVRDPLSGLDKVVVRLKSDNKTITLYEKSYEKRVEEDTLKVELDPIKLKLSGKSALLVIKAFDRSLWSSSGTLNAEIPVDLRAPKIEPVSTVNYLTVGGVGFIFYKIIGEKPAVSGVKLDQELYQGFAATYIDQAFSSNSNLYFAFFPVPLSCNEQDCEFKIYAEDIVGNKSNAKFAYDLTRKKYSDSVVELDSEYLTTQLPNTLNNYNTYKTSVNKDFSALKMENYDESKLLTLSILLKDFNVEKQAKVLFARPSSTRLWVDQFFYPGGSVSKPRFAERNDYSFISTNIASIVSPGIFFGSRAGTEIRATNTGRVLFSGDFGLLGKSIILDHGFGLTTVYSSLSKLNKVEGDKVTKGEVIGLSGRLELENRSGCMYQVRLHGEPVRPEEWWDPGWIKNRVFGQIDDAKKALGLLGLQ